MASNWQIFLLLTDQHIYKQAHLSLTHVLLSTATATTAAQTQIRFWNPHQKEKQQKIHKLEKIIQAHALETHTNPILFPHGTASS